MEMKRCLFHRWADDHPGTFGQSRTCSKCSRHEHWLVDRWKVPVKCWFREGQTNVYVKDENGLPF